MKMTDSANTSLYEPTDIHFEPVVTLSPVETKTMEEDEEEVFKMRCRLYRYDANEEPAERWRERGTGDIKILKHKKNSTCRILMRRDKTLKVCCNHKVLPDMELRPNCGSDRAWVWRTPADFADETKKEELLAVRFGNAENAKLFQKHFEDAKKIVSEGQNEDAQNGSENDLAENVAKQLKDLTVKEKNDEEKVDEKGDKDEIEKEKEDKKPKNTEDSGQKKKQNKSTKTESKGNGDT